MKPPSSQGDSSSSGLSPRFLLAGALSLLALIFVLQNTRPGRVRFLWLELTAPGWLGLLLVFAAGFVSGWLVHRRDRS